MLVIKRSVIDDAYLTNFTVLAVLSLFSASEFTLPGSQGGRREDSSRYDPSTSRFSHPGCSYEKLIILF